MPTPANAVAVMAKAPIPGSVKTRLVPPLSADQAAELSRALLLDLLQQLRGLNDAARYLCYAPAHAGDLMGAIAGPDFELVAQRGADLGARMAALFTDLSARGHRNIVLIGGDLPAFPADYLVRAFAYLQAPSAPVVLGPSRDGGYYLVGMNRPVPEIFQNMAWSHNQVLAQTLAKLGRLGTPARQLPSWFDVDIPADLARLRALDMTAAARARFTLSLLRQWDEGDAPAGRAKNMRKL